MTTASVSAPVSGEVTLPTEIPTLTLGWEVIKWAGKYLKHANGPRASKPFRFSDSQALFLLHYYSLTTEGRWVYDRAARRWPKGSGKALALDTPLPTPSGWTTMGDVKVGDELLDEHGMPTTVLAATPVLTGRQCYRVAFRDGTDIVADGDHLWPMGEFYGASARRPRIVSTADMAAEGVRFDRPLTIGRTKCRKPGVSKWRTLPTPSVDGTDVQLPIPAYLLGYWLGDGDSDGPRITVHRDDLPALRDSCERLGVECGEAKPTHGETFKVRFGGATGSGGVVGRDGRGWAKTALRDAELLGNKHIPATLMRGSRKQRLELLQGLMDSDGFVGTNGRAELTLTCARLADDAVELMRTLGLYPRRTISEAKLNGRVTGLRHRISVTAYEDDPIFTLPRKATRLRPRGSTIPISQVRTVTAIEPVESVPVRCVSVSGSSQLYLAGEGLVPTHNSPFAAVQSLAEFLGPVRLKDWDPKAMGGCVGKRQPLAHVQIAATTLDQTANTMKQVRAMAPKGSRVAQEYRLDVGMLRYNAPDGAMLEVITSSAAAAEGAEVTHATCDETEHWTPNRGGQALMEVIERNLSKSGSRLVETANAWQPGDHSVAESTWDMFCAQREGRTRGEARVLYDARVPAGVVLADEDELMAGLRYAYGDAAIEAGGWVDLRTQMNFILNGKTKADTARRFYLNQPTVSVDAWTTPHQWAKLADPTRIVADDEEIALFFDGSLSNDATALIGCCLSDGHVFTLGVWEPDPNDPDDEVSAAAVDLTVARAFDRFQVLGFFADVREWESFTKISWPERFADDLLVHAVPSGKEPQPIAWDMRGQTDAFTKAAELTLDEIETQAFTHDGDDRVARHVANARMRPNRSGTSIAKDSKDSPKKIDAAVCVIGARMVRRQVLASKEYAQRSRRGGGMVVWR